MSNLAVASFVTAQPEMPLVERIDCTDARQKAAARAAQRTRLRQRALDRSRRNTNAAQYGPSMRHHKRAERHTAKGLPAKQIANPGGARHAHTDGVPLRAYRHDELSQRHQRTRCDHAAESRHTSQAKQARASEIAAAIVAADGNTVTVEDCRVFTWAQLWGKRIAVFSPGMLMAALAAECQASGGQLFAPAPGPPR